MMSDITKMLSNLDFKVAPIINPSATGGQLCTDPVRSGPGRAGSCCVPALTLKLRNLHFVSLACSVVILIQFLGL